MRGRDMQNIYEVVQNFWGLISNISKKAYRNCAVIITGAAVVALISFNSKEFGGSGKNKTDLMQPKNSGVLIKEGESGEEEQLQQTEEIVSVSMRDTEVFVREAGQTEYGEKTEKELNITESQITTESQMIEENQIVTAEPLEANGEEEADGNQQQSTAETIEAAKEVMETDNPTVGTKIAEAKEEELKTAGIKQPDLETVNQKVVEAVNAQIENTPVIILDDTNYNVLLRIVEAEASGEGMEGKKLVVNVILNRVNHEGFPDSVEEVVFEKSGGHAQFSPTIDGRYESVTISEETVQAVEQVLNGEDNSQGALFFSARSKAEPDNMSWFDNNLKWLFEYGGHEFYTLP